MKAEAGKQYAVMNAGRVSQITDITTLPEWSEAHITVIEIPEGQTPSIGDTYAEGEFAAPSGPSLDALREAAKSAIDAACGEARLRYITSAPGQEAVYIIKAQQAAAFEASGYAGTVPSFIAAEAQATGLTPQATAERILTLEALWVGQIGPAIEGARVGGKDAVSAAVSADTIGSIVASVRAVLAELP
jgi:hypothetical protein